MNDEAICGVPAIGRGPDPAAGVGIGDGVGDEVGAVETSDGGGWERWRRGVMTASGISFSRE